MTTVEVHRKAQLQAVAADAWWRANRDKSDLFIEEFDAALADLELAPEFNPLCREPDRVGLRQRVMLKTRYVLFYRYDSAADHVSVVALWSSHRGGDLF